MKRVVLAMCTLLFAMVLNAAVFADTAGAVMSEGLTEALMEEQAASPAKEKVTTKLYYDGQLHDYSAEAVNISINGEYITKYNMLPVIINNRTLVPARTVFEKMGCTVDWNSESKKVTVIYGGDVIILTIGSNTAVKNDSEFNMDVPAKIINDYTMIPLRAVSEAIGSQVNWDADARLASISYEPIETTAVSTVQPTEAAQTTETAAQPTTELSETTTAKAPEMSNAAQKNDGITLLWDQVTNPTAVAAAIGQDKIQGLKVISPTWFSIADSQGTIKDIGSVEYVDWAHSLGYEVWALFSNSFSEKITHDTLSNYDIRQKIIANIVSMTEKYNLDGINIDFENLGKTDGEYYLQFVKEITAALKEKNIIVSVDMYIPTVWTEHYNMAEVGKIVDYVVIMAYDEHYSTSKESGSVASAGWVDKAMKNASEKVDNDKLIMGIPFYTRRWAEETVNGETKVSSVSMKMQEAYDILVENNAQIVWNEECGQYYGEYTIDGVVRKIWLEDERSIEEKLKISRSYDVKGVAFWKKGFEKETVWSVINNYY